MPTLLLSSRGRRLLLQPLIELREEEREVSNLVETELDGKEEECQRDIEEGLRQIRGRARLILPRRLDSPGSVLQVRTGVSSRLDACPK